jgi:hypothetical protein
MRTCLPIVIVYGFKILELVENVGVGRPLILPNGQRTVIYRIRRPEILSADNHSDIIVDVLKGVTPKIEAVAFIRDPQIICSHHGFPVDKNGHIQLTQVVKRSTPHPHLYKSCY